MSEHDKKQHLVRSADFKFGDFHLSISELFDGEFYSDATFEIIVVLDNICSLQPITCDLKNTMLFKNDSISTQLLELIGKISKETYYLLCDDGMNFVIQMQSCS